MSSSRRSLPIASLLLPVLALGWACPASVVCGDGTLLVDGTCLPTPDVAPDDDDDAPTPPPTPEFPAVIDVLTVDLRTSGLPDAAADDLGLQLCLSPVDCWPLDVSGIDELRAGELDTFTIEGLALPRNAVDRVELKISEEAVDAWSPSCLALAFDGERTYCNDTLDGLWFGREDAPRTSWEDESGLHRTCDRCTPDALTSGPLVGAVTDTSARIWLATDAAYPVGVHLVDPDAPTADSPVRGWVWTEASRGNSGVVDLTGLRADTEYRYWIEAGGEPQPGLHRFRTPPAPGTPSRFLIGLGSSALEAGQPIWDTIDRRDPDLLLLAGDNHGGGSGNLVLHRHAYRSARGIPGRADVIADRSTLATWDDRDYLGPDSDAFSSGKETALRVFGEHWANPPSEAAGAGTWFRSSWGDVDLFVLDARSHRGVQGSLLGEDQMAWLLDGLARSEAAFKLVVSPIQVTEAAGAAGWGAWQEDRDELLDAVRVYRIDGFALLSGNAGHSSFRRIDRTADGVYTLPEITSGPMAAEPVVCGDDAELVACSDGDRYYVELDVDTTAEDPQIHARIVDERGGEHADWTLRLSALSF